MASKSTSVLRGLLPLAFIAAMSSTVVADAPRQLKWADLIPKTMPAAPALKSKTFFGGSVPVTDAGPPPPPLPEGKFMSVKRHQPGDDRPPAIVAELEWAERFDRRLYRSSRFRVYDDKGVPPGAVRWRLHPCAAAASEPDHLREDRQGDRNRRSIRPRNGHGQDQYNRCLHRARGCGLYADGRQRRAPHEVGRGQAKMRLSAEFQRHALARAVLIFPPGAT